MLYGWRGAGVEIGSCGKWTLKRVNIALLCWAQLRRVEYGLLEGGEERANFSANLRTNLLMLPWGFCGVIQRLWINSLVSIRLFNYCKKSVGSLLFSTPVHKADYIVGISLVREKHVNMFQNNKLRVVCVFLNSGLRLSVRRTKQSAQ